MKRKEEKEPNHERWLLTYSDLITLLMIFFVVMYASSNSDTTKYKQLAQSLNVAFTGGGASIMGDSSAISVTVPSDKVIAPIEDPGADANAAKSFEENQMETIKKNVDKYLKQNGLSNSVSTKIDERGLQVSLNSTLLFDSGKADVKADSIKKLISIGKILNKVDNYVRIEGHTDSTPINNYEFRSNWQLSAVRATNVTELLISQAGIVPKRISAVAYGENRPIANNNTEAGKAKNRTVDIIILSSKFSKTENIK